MKKFPGKTTPNRHSTPSHKSYLSIILVAAALGLYSTVHAEVTNQEWFPQEFLVVDESGCSGEDGIAQVLTHVTIARMPQGFWSFHVNSKGTWTGLESGTELKWVYSNNGVIPITLQGSGRDQFIRTEQVRLRIIGQGSIGDFFLRGKLHLVSLAGEPTANFDTVTTVCAEE